MASPNLILRPPIEAAMSGIFHVHFPARTLLKIPDDTDISLF